MQASLLVGAQPRAGTRKHHPDVLHGASNTLPLMD